MSEVRELVDTEIDAVDVRELIDTELDAVSGGSPLIELGDITTTIQTNIAAPVRSL